MAPAMSIAGLSLGLKNTCANNSSKKSTYWAHERGLASEEHAILHYQSLGCELLGQRVKTPFAEVDLLFKTPHGHLLMVEVKTTNVSEFQMSRITKKQRARLERALIFMAERWDLPVEIHWAFVTKEGQVTPIEDISG